MVAPGTPPPLLLGPRMSRLQVLPVGLMKLPSKLDEGVIPLSMRRAAGRLQVDGLRVMPAERGISRNPVKLERLQWGGRGEGVCEGVGV